ncbi:MAG: site-specific integrase [Desulfobacterales bacterium]|nr:site-specific integrase [Desulfobacterales bacterium]
MTHERFVPFLIERRRAASSNTVFNNLRMMAMMLNVLAPDAEWGWLYRHTLAPRRHEAVASRRPVPIVQPGRLLFGLQSAIGEVLLGPTTKASALRLRDLLIVAVTATTALRRRNIVALTIGTTFLKHRHGYEIRYPGSAVKNERAISMMVMPELTASLDRYLESYRPLLFASGENSSKALWVSNLARRLAPNSMNAAFTRITSEILERKVNPHSLRHSAATAILMGDPLATAMASAALAHGNEATLSKFYDLSGDDAARGLWRKLSMKYRNSAEGCGRINRLGDSGRKQLRDEEQPGG